MPISEILLNLSWSLVNLAGPENARALRVQYVPRSGDRGLERAIGDANGQLHQLAGSGLENSVRFLAEEVDSRLPHIPNPTVGDIELTVRRYLCSIGHFLRWPKRHTNRVYYDVSYFVGNEQYQPFLSAPPLLISDLSSASQSTIRRLDGRATEIAYEGFASRVRGLSSLPPGLQLIPARRRVFVAYRSSDQLCAERLHGIFAAYANGTAFSVFLDRHDVRLGDLAEQLRLEIDKADLFVPIVTGAYAQPGSISAQELEWARDAAAAKGGIERFFAPVFVGTPSTPVATELGHLKRLQVWNVADLSGTSRDIQDFLKIAAVPY